MQESPTESRKMSIDLDSSMTTTYTKSFKKTGISLFEHAFVSKYMREFQVPREYLKIEDETVRNKSIQRHVSEQILKSITNINKRRKDRQNEIEQLESDIKNNIYETKRDKYEWLDVKTAETPFLLTKLRKKLIQKETLLNMQSGQKEVEKYLKSERKEKERRMSTRTKTPTPNFTSRGSPLRSKSHSNIGHEGSGSPSIHKHLLSPGLMRSRNFLESKSGTITLGMNSMLIDPGSPEPIYEGKGRSLYNLTYSQSATNPTESHTPQLLGGRNHNNYYRGMESSGIVTLPSAALSNACNSVFQSTQHSPREYIYGSHSHTSDDEDYAILSTESKELSDLRKLTKNSTQREYCRLHHKHHHHDGHRHHCRHDSRHHNLFGADQEHIKEKRSKSAGIAALKNVVWNDEYERMFSLKLKQTKENLAGIKGNSDCNMAIKEMVNMLLNENESIGELNGQIKSKFVKNPHMMNRNEVLHFIRKSAIVNSCINRSEFQKTIDKLPKEMLDRIELDIADRILVKYQNQKEITRKHRAEFLKNKNSRMKRSIWLYDQQKKKISKAIAKDEQNKRLSHRVVKYLLDGNFDRSTHHNGFVSTTPDYEKHKYKRICLKPEEQTWRREQRSKSILAKACRMPNQFQTGRSLSVLKLRSQYTGGPIYITKNTQDSTAFYQRKNVKRAIITIQKNIRMFLERIRFGERKKRYAEMQKGSQSRGSMKSNLDDLDLPVIYPIRSSHDIFGSLESERGRNTLNTRSIVGIGGTGGTGGTGGSNPRFRRFKAISKGEQQRVKAKANYLWQKRAKVQYYYNGFMPSLF